MNTITIKPLTPELNKDYLDFFDNRAFTDGNPNGPCYCTSPNQDEETIKNDFYIIKQKVKDGRAHELSESDTSYLGACTKARTSKDRTTQPNSEIDAKPRAYSLKNSYMTGILNSIGTTISFDTNEFKTVEDYVLSKLRPYIGKSQLQILEEITGQTYKEKIPKNLLLPSQLQLVLHMPV